MRRAGGRVPAWALVAAALVAPSAQAQYLVQNARGIGGFDLTYTPFEGAGNVCGAGAPPPLRVIPDPTVAPTLCREWLQSAAVDFGIPGADPGRWLSVYTEGGPSRPVLELSFPDPDREGTVLHRGLYAIAAPPDACASVYDLDAITDGYGAAGNIVPVEEIPPPRVISGSGDSSFIRYRIELDPIQAYGPGPAFLLGRRLFHTTTEPRSSDIFASFTEVLDTQIPPQPLGVVPPGTTSVDVRVPRVVPCQREFFVARLEYADSSTSRAYSAHAGFQELSGGPGCDVLFPNPTLEMSATVTPGAVVPLDAVTYTFEVRLPFDNGLLEPDNVVLWASFGQELSPGCVDLASATNLTCDFCDVVSLDPASGKLKASRAVGGGFTVSVDFTAGDPGVSATCRLTAWATSERHRYIHETATFVNDGSTPSQLLRDDSIAVLTPRPDLSVIFPLAVYRDPAPPFPFIDEVGLVGDASRPLVFYGHSGAANIYLVKEPALGTVRIER